MINGAEVMQKLTSVPYKCYIGFILKEFVGHSINWIPSASNSTVTRILLVVLQSQLSMHSCNRDHVATRLGTSIGFLACSLLLCSVSLMAYLETRVFVAAANCRHLCRRHLYISFRSRCHITVLIFCCGTF